ncbi:DUF2002 family protein [Lacisediminimonas profundi]|uniref:DUF2002 family protein n=1 Tax=Lacisediminimonas profundi TaxID=2603856 RepID=UPI00124AEAB4|nr:DUF2002 family protein [Lacisediminimonas profundi]
MRSNKNFFGHKPFKFSQMTVRIDQIEALLLQRGYSVIHETSKKRGYQIGCGLPIYLNLTSSTGETALIAYPDSGIDSQRYKQPDMRISERNYHSSNMRHFPKRMHTGLNPISFGWGLTFTSLLAAEACLDYLEGKTTR